MRRRKRNQVWKGAVAGAVGGLAGSWTMDKFMSTVSDIIQSRQKQRLALQVDEGKLIHPERTQQQRKQESDDATVQLAQRVAHVLGHELGPREKKIAGPLVHYAFGATVGAIYGELAEKDRGVSKASGVPFGAAVWLVADEIMVPALGLAQGPTAYPPSVHLQALGAHLVYGATTEWVRRGLLAVMCR